MNTRISETLQKLYSAKALTAQTANDILKYENEVLKEIISTAQKAGWSIDILIDKLHQANRE